MISIILASAVISGAAASGTPCPSGFEKGSVNAGTLALPPLANPKDAYVLFIKQPGKDETKYALPPGINFFRFSDVAIPDINSTCRYKTQLATPPAIKAITEADLSLSRNQLVNGRYPIQWYALKEDESGPTVDVYQISGTSSVTVDPTKPGKPAKFSTECYPEFIGKKIPQCVIELKPGTELTWTISALDEDGIVIAKSGTEGHIHVASTWVQRISDDGLKLQRSDTLSKLTATLPATLSYAKTQKGNDAKSQVYQTQFALIFNGSQEYDEFYPRAGLEAHLTSRGDEKSSDAIRLRLGVYKDFQGAKDGTGTEFTANLKYETEQKGGTKKGLLEVSFLPIAGWFGTYLPHTKLPDIDSTDRIKISPIQVEPVLTLGAEVGKTLDVGTSTETKDTVVRLRTDLSLNVEFHWLASVLSAHNVTGFANGTYWYLPLEDASKNRHLGSTGIVLGLTDEASLNFTYTVGRDAPDFKFSRSTSVSLGLKF